MIYESILQSIIGCESRIATLMIVLARAAATHNLFYNLRSMFCTPSPAVLPMAWQWGLLCRWRGSRNVHAGVSYPCSRRGRLRPADGGLQRSGGLGEQQPVGAEDLANGGRSTPTGSVLLLRPSPDRRRAVGCGRPPRLRTRARR